MTAEETAEVTSEEMAKATAKVTAKATAKEMTQAMAESAAIGRFSGALISDSNINPCENSVVRLSVVNVTKDPSP